MSPWIGVGLNGLLILAKLWQLSQSFEDALFGSFEQRIEITVVESMFDWIWSIPWVCYTDLMDGLVFFYFMDALDDLSCQCAASGARLPNLHALSPSYNGKMIFYIHAKAPPSA